VSSNPRTLRRFPLGFDQAAFFGGVHWHQKWQLFEGVFTPGVNSIEEMAADLRLPLDLTGKRVLDIGAWNGCLSFECERRGASEVVAIGPENPSETGFDRLHAVLGSKRTRYVLGSVYDLDPCKLGYFDVVLFCGVLYHLRYPLLGMDNLRRICTGEVFAETYVTDCRALAKRLLGLRRWSLVNLALKARDMLSSKRRLPAQGRDLPLWQFYRNAELMHDPSNWFGPTPEAVREAFASAGFDVQLTALKHGRATFAGRIQEGVPEFLRIGTAEGVFYDVIARHLFGKDKLGLGTETQRCQTAVLASDEFFAKAGHTVKGWLVALYQRLLDRPPRPEESQDADGGLLQANPVQRQAVAAAVLASPEYRTRLIRFWAMRFLGRKATEAELATGLRTLQRGGTEEGVLASFLASEEYFRRRGGSNRQWLASMAQDVLNGEPGADHGSWWEELEAGRTNRTEVASAFLASPSYRQRQMREFYLLYLGRPTVSGEPHDWARLLDDKKIRFAA
jgi:tRNA (mo5U34)-methyltransferase